MAQGNRRDEKMRSDRGEWDRKRTGSGNTDKRKGADLRGEKEER